MQLATNLLDCLKLLVQTGLSAVPVLGTNGEVAGIYSKFDAITMIYHDSVEHLGEINMQRALEIKVK